MNYNLSSMDVSGYTLARYSWPSSTSANAIVLIVHGMAEHAERYDHFATHLNQHHFTVYAHDQRGHGRSVATDNDLGHVGKGGWQSMIEDIDKHIELIQNEHPDLPIFILGHSMGSFVTTEYLIQFNRDLAGVILSGSCGKPPIKSQPGKLIARLERLRKGGRGFSRLLNFLVFGQYNHHLEAPKTKFDWLSRDEKIVNDYIEDPRCGFMMDIQFWIEFLDGLSAKSKPERMANIKKNTKMLLISGTDCPLGELTIGVKRLISELTQAGISNMKYSFYPKMRHELINEIGKEDVYDDVVSWFNEQL